MTKYDATKFWVSLFFTVLTTASLLGLPGWWGKGVGIALALVGSAGVYLKANNPLPPPVVIPPNPPVPGVQSGQ